VSLCPLSSSPSVELLESPLSELEPFPAQLTPDIHANAVESNDPALQVFKDYFNAQKAQLPFGSSLGSAHGSYCSNIELAPCPITICTREIWNLSIVVQQVPVLLYVIQEQEYIRPLSLLFCLPLDRFLFPPEPIVKKREYQYRECGTYAQYRHEKALTRNESGLLDFILSQTSEVRTSGAWINLL
jgi:hypothetical protein